MNVCVFCSACEQLDNAYITAARQLGRWAAQNGHTIVYGGVRQGLMEQLAQACKEAGGTTVGVVPRLVVRQGRVSDYADVLIHCEDLSDRKALMMERSDVFVALPGGIGTLDELFSVAAMHTIGYHHKPMLLLDVAGFWAPLANMLDRMARQGVIRGEWTDYIRLIHSPEEIAQ